MNAYEIRLELIRMAKEVVLEKWRNECDLFWKSRENNVFTEDKEFPRFPTKEDFNEVAEGFNSFINKKMDF